MKSILTIFSLTIFSSFHTFSQDINHPKVLPNRFTSENIHEIYMSNPDSIEGFNAKDSRTTINKTQLENGFLLAEKISQNWDGSVWINNYRYSNIYDGNNNASEHLFQIWSGSTWVDASKSSIIYDANNNPSELIIQGWNGSLWENESKYLYTYDGNNNYTESLYQTWNSIAWVNVEKSINTYDGSMVYPIYCTTIALI